MAEKNVVCFFCHESNAFDEKLSFRAECEKCGEDLHICKNCEFYDPSAYNECKETSADPVKEKERSNLCDFFRASSSQSSQKKEKDKLKAAAEALFKK